MTIYEELLQKVEQGMRFGIDFEKGNMRIGKKWLIKEGKWNEENQLIEESLTVKPVLKTIEEYYTQYKYSRPSERSDRKRRNYFKALSTYDLTDEQMICGIDRELAQAQLEGFILCMILSGNLNWNQEWGKWFWVSKVDKDLILLKKWIERSEMNVY